MLVLLSDTHATDDLPLTDHLQQRLSSASLVAHAGDFTTAAVLEEFETHTAELVAVAGNSDSPAVCAQLPESRAFEYEGKTIALTHGHRHDRTALSLLARQEGAGVVVVGHTHRVGVDHIGDVAVVNPGSHADPRGGQPTVAVVRVEGCDVRVQFETVRGKTRDGVVL